MARLRPDNPFGFLSGEEPGATAPDEMSIEELLRRFLPVESPGSAASAKPEMPMSEVLESLYGPPDPYVLKYPPIRGFGYRIPIIPEPEPPVPSFFERPGPPEPSPSNLYGFFPPQRRVPASVPPPRIERAPDDPLLPSPSPQVPRLTVELPGTPAGRIADAAARAVGDLFDAPLGISKESMGPLTNQGPEDYQGARAYTSLIRTFNKVLIQGGSQALDGAGRLALAPLVGGIAAVTQAAREAGMSETDAQKLERDFNALAVSTSVVSGGALGGPPRVPWPRRVLAEADLRGVIDDAVRTLPRDARGGVKKRLRDAFKAGEDAGKEAAEAQAGAAARPEATPIAAAPKAGSSSKSLLTELPERSHTLNPITAEEFRSLPENGTIDPHRIRTLQQGASRNFKPDPEAGENYTVLGTANQLRADPSSADKIPPVRIFEHDGRVYTLDHRRLVSHRLADVPIQYRKATPKEIEDEFNYKHDPDNDGGMSIEIRQNPGKGAKK